MFRIQAIVIALLLGPAAEPTPAEPRTFILPAHVLVCVQSDVALPAGTDGTPAAQAELTAMQARLATKVLQAKAYSMGAPFMDSFAATPQQNNGSGPTSPAMNAIAKLCAVVAPQSAPTASSGPLTLVASGELHGDLCAAEQIDACKQGIIDFVRSKTPTTSTPTPASPIAINWHIRPALSQLASTDELIRALLNAQLIRLIAMPPHLSAPAPSSPQDMKAVDGYVVVAGSVLR